MRHTPGTKLRVRSDFSIGQIDALTQIPWDETKQQLKGTVVTVANVIDTNTGSHIYIIKEDETNSGRGAGMFEDEPEGRSNDVLDIVKKKDDSPFDDDDEVSEGELKNIIEFAPGKTVVAKYSKVDDAMDRMQSRYNSHKEKIKDNDVLRDMFFDKMRDTLTIVFPK